MQQALLVSRGGSQPDRHTPGWGLHEGLCKILQKKKKNPYKTHKNSNEIRGWFLAKPYFLFSINFCYLSHFYVLNEMKKNLSDHRHHTIYVVEFVF